MDKAARIATLLADYAHGLEHNAPRSQSELNELTFLFGVSDVDPQAVKEPSVDELKAKQIADDQAKVDADQKQLDADEAQLKADEGPVVQPVATV